MLLNFARPRLELLACAALLLGACPSGDATTTEGTSGTDASTTSSTAPPTTTDSCEIGMNGCPCAPGGACDPGLLCGEGDLCWPADATTDDPPATATTDDETTATTTATATSTTLPDPTTDPGETTDTTGEPAECEPDAEGESDICVSADPSRPFCSPEGVCVACDDAAIKGVVECDAATGGARPLCLASGACGQCDSALALEQGQCEAAAPHCNLETNTCEGCFEHSECPATACDIKARKCFPEDQLVYVRQSQCEDQLEQGGSEQNPYCDVSLAIASVLQDGAFSGWTFKILASDNMQGHPPIVFPDLIIDQPVSYAIIHEFGGLLDAHTRIVGLGPLLSVPEKVNLYLVDFTVEVKNGFNMSHIGIDCQEGAELWLDGSRVLHSHGPGIRAVGCPLHLRRSAVAFGKTGGVDISDAPLHLVNSFIADNGDAIGGAGVQLRAGAELHAVYSTLVDNVNKNMSSLGDTIDCDAGGGKVDIRNSILGSKPGSNNPSVLCDAGTVVVSNSLVDVSLDKPNEEMSENNKKEGSQVIVDLLKAVPLTGEYRPKTLLEAAQLRGIPQWAPGDPRDDVDRDARAVGTLNDMLGADFMPE